MRTITVNLRTIGELNEQERARALDKYRYWNVECDEWYEYTLAQWKEILEIIGISDADIRFRGFCSQGDGASFTGYYGYNKGALSKLRKEYPNWSELHEVVRAIQDIQKRFFYTLTCELYRFGHHYSHENTVGVTGAEWCKGWLPDSVEDELLEPMRDLMRMIYSQLEQEYDYLTSDDAVYESLLINEVEFNESI